MIQRRLSLRHRQFIEEYLQTFNASEAARRCGYRSASEHGYEVLSMPEIQRIIRQRLEQRVMGQDEVLDRLSAQARADYTEFLVVEPDGTLRLDFEAMKAAGKLHLLQEVTYGAGTTTAKFQNVQRALELLGKHYSLFVERVDGNLHVDSTDLDLSRLSIDELREFEQLLTKAQGSEPDDSEEGATEEVAE